MVCPPRIAGTTTAWQAGGYPMTQCQTRALALCHNIIEAISNNGRFLFSYVSSLLMPGLVVVVCGHLEYHYFQASQGCLASEKLAVELHFILGLFLGRRVSTVYCQANPIMQLQVLVEAECTAKQRIGPIMQLRSGEFVSR